MWDLIVSVPDHCIYFYLFLLSFTWFLLGYRFYPKFLYLDTGCKGKQSINQMRLMNLLCLITQV